jgi:hypothetical protein
VHLTAHHQVTPEGAGGAVTSITFYVIICTGINRTVMCGGMEAEKGCPVVEKE